MRTHHLLLFLAFFCADASRLNGAEESDPSLRIQLQREDGKLVVRARVPGVNGWSKLATYITDPALRPYLHPVYDASGNVVLTQDRPDDHPWQHGIFTGFHRVNGFNYWKEDEGRQRFIRLTKVRENRESVSWTAHVELVSPNGEVVLEEENSITIHAPKSPDSYLIDFNLLLRAKEKDVQFGKFFVSGLSVRMPWDKEDPRQRHLNSEGVRGRAGEQKRAAWCIVERPFGDQIYGIAIFDHPRNANHPPAWRVDEQGLINPNISGLSDWSIPAGEERRFRYQLLVYRGPATAEELAAQFRQFSAE